MMAPMLQKDWPGLVSLGWGRGEVWSNGEGGLWILEIGRAHV